MMTMTMMPGHAQGQDTDMAHTGDSNVDVYVIYIWHDDEQCTITTLVLFHTFPLRNGHDSSSEMKNNPRQTRQGKTLLAFGTTMYKLQISSRYYETMFDKEWLKNQHILQLFSRAYLPSPSEVVFRKRSRIWDFRRPARWLSALFLFLSGHEAAFEWRMQFRFRISQRMKRLNITILTWRKHVLFWLGAHLPLKHEGSCKWMPCNITAQIHRPTGRLSQNIFGKSFKA